MRSTKVPLKDAAGYLRGDNSTALIFGPQNLEQIFGYSIQAFFLDGSPAGTLTLQGSNDGTNFCAIQAPFTVTGVGSYLWNVPASNYLWTRITWTPDGGGSSGHLSAIAFIRGI